jgi:hypothetical protein
MGRVRTTKNKIMSRVKIKDGGKMGDFRGGKLTAIRVSPSDTNTKCVQLYLETSEGDDNLSYLTLDEAVELKAVIDKAVKEAIENYYKD